MNMKRGFKPRVRVFLGLAATAVLAGCTHPGFTAAQEARARGYYIEAAEAARVAVEDAPDVPKYKELHDECCRRAAEMLVKSAEENMQAGDLSGAEHSAARALAYDPENQAALALKSKVFGMKQQTLEQLAESERLIAGQKPDEAVLLLEKLLPKSATYPQIKQTYQRALISAYNLHLSAGIKAFETQDYEGACKAFETARMRLPSRTDGQTWLTKALKFLKAQQLFESAGGAFARGLYQEAHIGFKQALAQVPDHPDARKGVEKALYHWTDQVYMKAREHEGDAAKPALCQALDLYLRCQSMMHDFKDVAERMQPIRRRLAEIYVEEGEYFLRQPNLQAIGLAHFCLMKAAGHDPANRRAQALLPQVERLFEIYRRVTVRIDITGKGRYPADLGEAIARKLASGRYPDLEAAVGRTTGVHAERDAEVRATAAALGAPVDPLDVPYSILQIAGEVENDYAKKTGADKPLPVASAYLSHSEQLPNIEYHEVEVGIAHWTRASDAAGLEAGALEGDLAAATEEHERCRRRHTTAAQELGRVRLAQEQLYSSARDATARADAAEREAGRLEALADSATRAANALLAQAVELERKAAAAQTQAQKEYYRRQAEQARASAAQKQQEAQASSAAAANQRVIQKAANNEAEDFLTRGRAFEPQVLQLGENERLAAAGLSAAAQHLQTAQSALADARSRRNAARSSFNNLGNMINRIAPTTTTKVATSYTFSRHHLQVFGCVAADLHILAEQDGRATGARSLQGGQVLARPSVNVSRQLSKQLDREVHEADINGYKNTTDTLPSAEQFKEGLEQEATAGIVAQLKEFFRSHHQKRFYNTARRLASEKQEIPAANAYACFLACETAGSMASEARDFLENLCTKQLR